MRRMVLGVLAALACSGAARAEVAWKGDAGFRLKYVAQVAAPSARVYAAIGEIGRWWNAAHTYSGSSTNLSLPLQAGGCFCEAWPGGGVRHGVVELALPDRVLRLDAALGPLQDEGVAAAWTFALKPRDGGTEVTVTYNVGGLRPEMAAAAPQGVDEVLGDQVARFKRYVETGKP